MMSMKRRYLAGAAGALACAVALSSATLAMAGSTGLQGHHVYTDWGLKGLDSPFRWADDGSSPSGTWLTFYKCHFNDGFVGNPEPRIQLKRQRTGLPDVALTEIRLRSCAVSASGNWGNQSKGTYYYKITDFDPVVNDTTQLHVTNAKVDY